MSDEGFLSRWSRRKRSAVAGLPVAEPATEALPAATTPAPPSVPEEPPFDVASLPSIDSLTAATDFTAFLRKEVPEALKRAALRKAWALDPAIRDFVGPADYAWDYNAPDGVPGFSLEIGGDVRELLAQVFGPEPVPPTAAGDAAEAGETAAADAAPAMPAAPEEEPQLPPALVTAAEPPSTPDAAPQVANDPDPLPARRHGSALPS
jgi:hypothetical protein